MDYTDINGNPIDISKKAKEHIQKNSINIKEQKKITQNIKKEKGL